MSVRIRMTVLAVTGVLLAGCTSAGGGAPGPASTSPTTTGTGPTATETGPPDATPALPGPLTGQ
ncbi:alpha/beta hydrolase, partial [Streptomyces sp. SR27]|nr:alpha/beta hydrolase [Streptomyces sp. SR27]